MRKLLLFVLTLSIALNVSFAFNAITNPPSKHVPIEQCSVKIPVSEFEDKELNLWFLFGHGLHEKTWFWVCAI